MRAQTSGTSLGRYRLEELSFKVNTYYIASPEPAWAHNTLPWKKKSFAGIQHDEQNSDFIQSKKATKRSMGQGDGSVGKGPAVQALVPESSSPGSMQNIPGVDIMLIQDVQSGESLKELVPGHLVNEWAIGSVRDLASENKVESAWGRHPMSTNPGLSRHVYTDGCIHPTQVYIHAPHTQKEAIHMLQSSISLCYWKKFYFLRDLPNQYSLRLILKFKWRTIHIRVGFTSQFWSSDFLVKFSTPTVDWMLANQN